MDGWMDEWTDGRTDGWITIYYTYCLYTYNICDWHWTEHIDKWQTCLCACLTYMQTFFKHNQTMEWHLTSAQEWLDSEVPARPCCTEPRQSILIHLTIRVRTRSAKKWSYMEYHGHACVKIAEHKNSNGSRGLGYLKANTELSRHRGKVTDMAAPNETQPPITAGFQLTRWSIYPPAKLKESERINSTSNLCSKYFEVIFQFLYFFWCVSRCFPTSASPASTSSSSFSPQLG